MARATTAERTTFAGNILYCDSRGDKRFSPFFCWLDAFGERNSIENFYQRAKVFHGPHGTHISPSDWRQAKAWQKAGRTRHDEFLLPDGRYCPGKYLVFGWYASLWLKYLDLHPELVEEASAYETYVDRFKYGFPLCQADCVRLYVKQGRPALLAHCVEFFGWLRMNPRR